ncbi:prepilin-type N-terminal cleavage/methylation domain-containing protein [Luteimonas granuli]|uniref:Prepilin-type N-terminal cleavage/methylation domain-containing protein n=1 Tax=Luteimonas granuli TaxID=1176533 RepID=A0A518N5B8_9GAMM|nr:prepilin-type N-terminal cleavage/methylation domain-containing protein [Luteimonas granuli]QDW67111.1 prepilin-type N-terminal cleavage/methylation domain-containing protein [Luteimonas granuli]
MNRARATGFTLIEVLLAIALLATGLALGFATLRAATATVERGETLAARSERMRAVEGFLRRRLASALPIVFARDADTGNALRFVGEPDRIRFVADLPDYLGRGGPHLHDVAVVGEGAEAALAVSFTMVLAGETIVEDAPRPPEPLVEGLTGLRIRYRGLDEDGSAEWLDAWDAHDSLPLQVSIEIESAQGGTWPPLVVALPQGGSP